MPSLAETGPALLRLDRDQADQTRSSLQGVQLRMASCGTYATSRHAAAATNLTTDALICVCSQLQAIDLALTQQALRAHKQAAHLHQQQSAVLLHVRR